MWKLKTQVLFQIACIQFIEEEAPVVIQFVFTSTNITTKKNVI